MVVMMRNIAREKVVCSKLEREMMIVSDVGESLAKTGGTDVLSFFL